MAHQPAVGFTTPSAIDLAAIKALPVAERQRIVEDILESIAIDSADEDPDAELKAELAAD